MMLLAVSVLLAAAPAAKPDAGVPWLGDAMPLQLSVKTPEDLTFKAAAERFELNDTDNTKKQA
jgi:hypothetical protein